MLTDASVHMHCADRPVSHCRVQQERRGERLLARASLALVAVQAACTYVVWVATVQQAQHQHHD